MKTKRKFRLSTWQFLALGYLGVILVGAALLLLPFATVEGETTSVLGALFTSTSATCVTGLIVYDTGSHWTMFGQIVIICLIQLGGLGFMTIVSTLLRLFGKSMSLFNSKAMLASSGAANRNDIRRLFYHILIGTCGFELIGATLLALRFVPQFGVGRGIYLAIWHSVSAFCNAGFDLMGSVSGGAKFVSFTGYATDPLVTLTLAGLIILGGLGFCVWEDVIAKRFRFQKFTLHTKLVLSVTAGLLLVSTLLFLFFERDGFLSEHTFGNRLLISFFNATTPRTAGMNTVDLTQLSDSGYMLTNILMFIGGSSASTAGGIKITTVFVVLAGIIAVFRGKQDIELGRKRLPNSLVHQALAVLVSCLMMVLVAAIAICAIESHNFDITAKEVLFETFSAMGTVGLTLGITPHLLGASKIILMLMMYAGRVGILTIALAFGEKRDTHNTKRPLDNILIG